MAFTTRNAGTGDPGVSELVQGKLNRSANSRNQVCVQEPDALPNLWTYIGQECIGRFYSGPDGFGAFSGTGAYIGTFASTTAARSAIWDHHCKAAAPVGT